MKMVPTRASLALLCATTFFGLTLATGDGDNENKDPEALRLCGNVLRRNIRQIPDAQAIVEFGGCRVWCRLSPVKISPKAPRIPSEFHVLNEGFPCTVVHTNEPGSSGAHTGICSKFGVCQTIDSPKYRYILGVGTQICIQSAFLNNVAHHNLSSTILNYANGSPDQWPKRSETIANLTSTPVWRFCQHITGIWPSDFTIRFELNRVDAAGVYHRVGWHDVPFFRLIESYFRQRPYAAGKTEITQHLTLRTEKESNSFITMEVLFKLQLERHPINGGS